MFGGKWNIGQSIVSALLGLAGGIGLYHYTTKTADLVYEVFPPARFTNAISKISIYTVRVENAGTKEVVGVQVHLALPEGILVEDVQTEPTASAIEYTAERRGDHALEVRFPFLNPGEGARFALLVNEVDTPDLSVSVRGNGVVGRPRSNEGASTIARINAVLLPIAAVLSVAAGVLALSIRFGELEGFLQGIFSKQLRVLRTQPTTPAKGASSGELVNLLTGRPYRFFFNPKFPGLKHSKVMRFGKNGAILEGNNNNQATWRLAKDLLEFVNAKGEVHNRFYYSPSDQTFYHTNDDDLVSTSRGVRDQYMVPEVVK